MRINEMFYTIQGEGRTMGLPTVFLRTTGCNLRCTWCDTTYSFYEGQEWSVEEALRRIGAYPAKRVCLTGGEPLLQKESLEVMQGLLTRGYEVTLETSGSIHVGAAAKLAPRRALTINLDVKCPSSAMQDQNDWANLPLLEPHDQLKFVIAGEEDYAYARRVLAERPNRAEKVFQACWQDGRDNLPWLAERVLRDGVDVRVGTQLHKHIWGEERAR